MFESLNQGVEFHFRTEEHQSNIGRYLACLESVMGQDGGPDVHDGVPGGKRVE